jgi:glycosyltransferase involved in cell wall biosynthesis
MTHRAFADASARPDAMLITNHGYAGAEIPIGGAPDTGGQIFYVNAMARALDQLGWRVTIVARGGFPHFDSDRLRIGREYLSDHVRYLFVPGGGVEFIPKEEISVALDEQTAWLDGFVQAEADARGVRPWEVYPLINSHYWDAAVIGLQLTTGWRDDRAAELLAQLCRDEVPAEVLRREQLTCRQTALGGQFPYHVGRLLMETGRATGRAHEVGRRWLASRDPDGDWKAHLAGVDHHVWTPHSLGALKEDNFRDKPHTVVRPLQFCQRRNHERAICARVRAFASTSAEIGERLHTHYDVDPDRIFDFPPCVDRERFRPYSDEELVPVYAWLAERSGIAANRLTAGQVVFEASRNDHTKRKDLLLRAFARAVDDDPEVFLFVAGGPDNEVHDELVALSESDPVLTAQAVLLRGRIPDEVLFPLFSLADVYCSPSEMEGFGMSAAQAAAAGTALITSDLVPFSIQYGGDAAKVVAAGDEAGFTEALIALLSDAADRGRRGQALLEATRALDWVEVTRSFLGHLGRPM